MPDTREVYENVRTHELSFHYDQEFSVCVGETDGTLTDWLEWHKQQCCESGYSDVSQWVGN